MRGYRFDSYITYKMESKLTRCWDVLLRQSLGKRVRFEYDAFLKIRIMPGLKCGAIVELEITIVETDRKASGKSLALR